jgi:hypothetical protein
MARQDHFINLLLGGIQRRGELIHVREQSALNHPIGKCQNDGDPVERGVVGRQKRER